PAGELGGDEQRRIFRVARGLEPERAADILGDDAQLFLRPTHHGNDLVALRSRTLRAGAQGVAVGRRIMARGCAAGLHRGNDETLVDSRDACHVRGARKYLLDLARVAAVILHRTGPVDRDIAWRL